MSIRFLAGMVVMVVLGLIQPRAATAQLPGLNAGTVTATVDGVPFSANVSIATVDDEGRLVLTSLSNIVQIQVPNARIGAFAITLNADGGLVDVIVGLRVGRRQVTPVSGTVTIETLSAAAAAGRFEFTGKDIATEAPVKVTGGRFQVKLTGGA